MKIKICITTSALIKGDGQGRVNYEIAREAIRRGHHLTLLATRVAQAARTIAQQHSWTSMAQSYVDLFELEYQSSKKSDKRCGIC